MHRQAPRAGGRKESSARAFSMARGWDAAYGYFGVNAR
jgi:hypothetical protein